MNEPITRNDIVQDAYYLISLFENDNKAITQLQVQKLMYLFEAYYMYKKNEEGLYDCAFKAWGLGPVAIPLYKKFSVYGGNKITIDEEQRIEGQNITSEKKKMIKAIYDAFGIFTGSQLVSLTHMPGSPWETKWKQNGEKVLYDEQANIDKLETREWFRKEFINERKK